MERIENKLQELYDIHDYFFGNEKENLLQEKSNIIINELNLLQNNNNQNNNNKNENDNNDNVDDNNDNNLINIDLNNREIRAYLSWIRGKTLDVFEQPSNEAEEYLIKSIKLDPTKIKYWNALGHCFWKKGDMQGACNAFEEAVNIGQKNDKIKNNEILNNDDRKLANENREALRNLSMILRQLPVNNKEELIANIEKSIEKATQAVKFDIADGQSWYVLGNGYTTKFFRCSQSHDDLRKALQAFRTAERYQGETNPDLYFNKANVLRFMEEYTLALQSYHKAYEIDPQLPLHQSEDIIDSIWRKGQKTVNMLRKKCGIKVKKLNKLVQSLLTINNIPDFIEQSYNMVDLTSLNIGENKNKAIALKLLLKISTDSPPETFIMTDRSKNVIAVALYQISETRRFTNKDTFIILDPYKKHIVIEDNNNNNNNNNNNKNKNIENNEDEKKDNNHLIHRTIEYDCIHVISSQSLLINNERPSNIMAYEEIKITHFDK